MPGVVLENAQYTVFEYEPSLVPDIRQHDIFAEADIPRSDNSVRHLSALNHVYAVKTWCLAAALGNTRRIF